MGVINYNVNENIAIILAGVVWRPKC